MSADKATFVEKFRDNPLPFMGIVFGNLLPLMGVLEWGWSIFEIFYLYWYSNVIIGVFMIIRMLLASVQDGIVGLIGGLFMGAFFTVHYGTFCLGHGMIMTEIFYPGDMPFELTEKTLLFVPWLAGMKGFIWALGGIVLVESIYNISRMFSEHKNGANAGLIMFAPYGRIIILHLTILIGGGMSFWLGFPPAALIFLIALKIIYDLGLYSFEPNMSTLKPKDKNALG